MMTAIIIRDTIKRENDDRGEIMEFKDLEIFQMVAEKGVLIEGDGLCAIYANGYFDFVCTEESELGHMLATKGLQMKELKGDLRLCSECATPMQEGFYFESDGTQYCSEKCLTKVISWEDYLEIHNDGQGDAYWTDWYDC